jgi:hypothetical protein
LDNLQSDNDEPTAQRHNPTRVRQVPARYREPTLSIYLTNALQPDFTASRQKELDGLIQRGVFEFITVDQVPTHACLFNSRFVDNIKLAGTPNAYKKSRLVVQAYNDSSKKTVLTQSPTIQRVSQRLILCLAVSIKGLDIYLRDISQAYTQSHTSLTREFYVRPPQELNLLQGVLLKILRPLYGIPEAGTHWFRTYHNHYIEKLDLQQASYDPCLLFTTKSNNEPQAIVGLQTDDTLFASNTSFKDKEQEQLRKAQFLAKPLQKLTTHSPLEFNGAILTKSTTTGSITISQSKQVEKIKLIDINNATQEQYIA